MSADAVETTPKLNIAASITVLSLKMYFINCVIVFSIIITYINIYLKKKTPMRYNQEVVSTLRRWIFYILGRSLLIIPILNHGFLPTRSQRISDASRALFVTVIRWICIGSFIISYSTFTILFLLQYFIIFSFFTFASCRFINDSYPKPESAIVSALLSLAFPLNKEFVLDYNFNGFRCILLISASNVGSSAFLKPISFGLKNSFNTITN